MTISIPVMPWVRVYIEDGIASARVGNWCRDTIGSPGVDWYLGIGDGDGGKLFYSFRYEADAIMFRLRFGL